VIVGILGEIGSGKSTVSEMFVELGAEALDADRMAHEVIETPAARDSLLRWLGEAILGPDGRVDRAAVARRVFGDEAALRRLEAIVHPEVLRRIEERVEAYERADAAGTLVLDVPLLPLLPLKDRCDHLVYVDAPFSVRLRRVAARGWDSGDLRKRESFQPSDEEKRRLADFVIVNSGDLADTRARVTELYGKMEGLRRGRGGRVKEGGGGASGRD
jgi:dephospho-CoA kinase